MARQPPILEPIGTERKGARMYYLTTTIDEAGMIEIMADAADRMNKPMKKHQPFEIMRTEEPADVEAMPTVMLSTFHLAFTGDAPPVKNAAQCTAFVAAIADALEEIRRLNEGNYIVVHPPRRGQPPH